MKKILTSCLVFKQHKEILLGMKKYGFSEGKWNAFLGMVEDGADIEDTAKRELAEGAEIEISNLEKMGILEFEFHGDPDINEVHIFKASTYRGEIMETNEIRPEWFHIDHIPFDAMWQDNKYWMPLLFQGSKFIGKFFFDKDQNIISHSLVEVDKFS